MSAPEARHPAGTPVRVEMTKWGGLPHWEFAGVFLGLDEHGEWLGFPAGTSNRRPGAAFVSQVDAVTLLPLMSSGGAAHVVTFNAPGIWCEVYVDIATPPTWDLSGPVPVARSVDLDLDVIRLPGPAVAGSPVAAGRVYVDDEDEFAEHRVSLGYPPEIVTLAESSCARVLADVRAGLAPYDADTSRAWLARLHDPARNHPDAR